MKRKSLLLLRVVCFILCAGFMLSFIANIFVQHATTDTGFFKLPRNSVDILYLGNCHAYSTFMPTLIENKTGKNGFVYGGSSQDVKMTYFYLREALKTQSPEYVVMETFPITIYDSYVSLDTIYAYASYNFTDLPFNFDRLLYAFQYNRDRYAAEAEYDPIPVSRTSLFTTLPFFHQNWENIQGLERNTVVSMDNGYTTYHLVDPLSHPEDILTLVQTDDRMDIDPTSLLYLNKIIDLTQSRGMQLILVTVPYTSMTEREAARYNTLADIAEERSIPYVNFASSELLEKLDFKRGFMIDDNHVNQTGGCVISSYLADYMKQSMETAE